MIATTLRRRPGRPGRFFLVVLLAAISVSSPCLAAESDSPETTLIVQGIDLLKAGNYEGARQAFASAYEIRPASATLLKLGLAELESGHPVDAARHLRSYIHRPDAPPDKVQAILRKWLPAAEAQTSRLKIDAPAGAEIVVDGRVEGQAPLDLLDVSIGKHDVTARQGSWSESREVTTVAGGPPETLEFRPPVAPAATGQPAIPISAMPRVTADSRPSRAKLITVIGAGSAALIAAGLGIAFAVANRNNANDASAIRAQIRNPANTECREMPVPAACSTLHHEVDAQDQTYRLALGFYGSAGALAAVALTSWFLWPTRTDDRRRVVSQLVPMVGQDRAGMGLGGTW